jgi:hypothetical protein
VPDLSNLPTLLKWEISLALLVLLWSLISLTAPRWRRRLRRRPPHPVNVVHLPLNPVSMGRGSAWQRARTVVVAAGLALAAASLAFATPTIIGIAPQKQRRVDGPRLRPRPEPAVARPADGDDRGRPGPAREARDDGASAAEPLQGSEQGAALVPGAGATPLEPRAGTPTPGPAPMPTPEPTPEPTPTPTLEPTPEPTPTPTLEPTPTTTPSES